MSDKLMKINPGCRICGYKGLRRFLKLGPQPLANSFLKIGDQKVISGEIFFPLDVYFCPRCTLVQLKDVVKPEIMFRHYLYVSSTSPVLVKHFRQMAKQITQGFKLTKKDLVVDVGANDGTLLRQFKNLGTQVLGVDPAKNIARRTSVTGIKVIPEFFNQEVARKINRQYGHAAVITGTNVFAHINDIEDVIEGVKELLDDEGIFVIEVPYLMDFLDKNEFDTVYHEHLSYFSVRPLVKLFEKFGMRIFDVQRVAVQGGSIRVFVKRAEASWRLRPMVKKLLALEKVRQLDELSMYKKFAGRVKQNRQRLVKLLKQLKRRGKTIVGYGAAAKGNTLLNYFGIDTQFLDYIVDDSPFKVSYLTPGTHIPVYPTNRLYELRPDYVLILAWNFGESIMAKHRQLRKLGVRFILPIPRPKIV